MNYAGTGLPLIDGPPGASNGMIERYLQPIAQHTDHPERLLLRGADGHWYVWTGESPTAPPSEIAVATAAWLLIQPGLRLLPGPHVWLHPSDLPLYNPESWSARADSAAGDAAVE